MDVCALLRSTWSPPGLPACGIPYERILLELAFFDVFRRRQQVASIPARAPGARFQAALQSDRSGGSLSLSHQLLDEFDDFAVVDE